MPERKKNPVDWKALARRMNIEGVATPIEGSNTNSANARTQVLLEAGKRKSRGNDKPVSQVGSRSDILGLMEYLRKQPITRGTRRRQLKGLFGGGEDK